VVQYHAKQPGDVLHLPVALPRADAGYYMYVGGRPNGVRLIRLVVDLEAQTVEVTTEQVMVRLSDLALFEFTDYQVVSRPRPAGITLGSIIEPRSDVCSLPVGLYQVVKVDGDDFQVSRLHANEDGDMSTTGRTSWLSRAELGEFREVDIDNRPNVDSTVEK
jgi:hypothetical protein